MTYTDKVLQHLREPPPLQHYARHYYNLGLMRFWYNIFSAKCRIREWVRRLRNCNIKVKKKYCQPITCCCYKFLSDHFTSKSSSWSEWKIFLLIFVTFIDFMSYEILFLDCIKKSNIDILRSGTLSAYLNLFNGCECVCVVWLPFCLLLSSSMYTLPFELAKWNLLVQGSI